MAFLTIGGTTIPCDSSPGGVTREEDDVIGVDVRAFAGNMRSTQQFAKRVWTARTPFLTAAQQTTVLATIGYNKTVSGDIVAGASVACVVRSLNGPHRKSWGLPKRQLVLSIKEI